MKLLLCLLFYASTSSAVIQIQNITCNEASPTGHNSVIQISFDLQGTATVTGMATQGGTSYGWSMFGPFRASGAENSTAISLAWTDSANQVGTLLITLVPNPANPYSVGVGVSNYGSLWTNSEMDCIRAL